MLSSCWRNLTRTQYYYLILISYHCLICLICHLYSAFTNCPPNVFCGIFFFWSGMQYRITCGVCLISLFSFNLKQFLAFLGLSWPWHFWRAEPVVLRNALRDVFSVHQIRRHLKLICSIIGDTYFDHLVKVVFARALHCQGTVLFFPLAVYN